MSRSSPTGSASCRSGRASTRRRGWRSTTPRSPAIPKTAARRWKTWSGAWPWTGSMPTECGWSGRGRGSRGSVGRRSTRAGRGDLHHRLGAELPGTRTRARPGPRGLPPPHRAGLSAGFPVYGRRQRGGGPAVPEGGHGCRRDPPELRPGSELIEIAQPNFRPQPGQRSSVSRVDLPHHGQGRSRSSAERSTISRGSTTKGCSRLWNAKANNPVVAVAATSTSNKRSSCCRRDDVRQESPASLGFRDLRRCRRPWRSR